MDRNNETLNAYIVGVRTGFTLAHDWSPNKPANPYVYVDNYDLHMAWLDGFIFGMRMGLAEGR